MRKPPAKKPRKKPVEKIIDVSELSPPPERVGDKPRMTKPTLLGNRFWEARSKHGRDKIFTKPEILMEACQEYLAWVEDNPMQEAKAFAYEGEVTIEAIPKMRVMTIGSLTMFLDISETTWWEYAKRDGFAEICERVGKAIREQKFAGATSGFFNHAIIARDLGLVDKKELTGADGGPIRTESKVITSEMTPKEAMEAWKTSLIDDE